MTEETLYIVVIDVLKFFIYFVTYLLLLKNRQMTGFVTCVVPKMKFLHGTLERKSLKDNYQKLTKKCVYEFYLKFTTNIQKVLCSKIALT